jgi:hypothetical protein
MWLASNATAISDNKTLPIRPSLVKETVWRCSGREYLMKARAGIGVRSLQRCSDPVGFLRDFYRAGAWDQLMGSSDWLARRSWRELIYCARNLVCF